MSPTLHRAITKNQAWNVRRLLESVLLETGRSRGARSFLWVPLPLTTR